MKDGVRRELLTGWGRTAPSSASVVHPRSHSEVEDLVCGDSPEDPGRRLARGLGRSYGDAAQCGGGTVIDCGNLDAIVDLDERARTLRVESGASFDSILKFLVPRGFFLPVTPGTRFVSVGGAIASDIHGKNHHVDGSFSRFVETFKMVAPTGSETYTPDRNRDEFDATCGGMGLTGVITEATLRLLPIETSQMIVDTERVDDLDACMSILAGERGAYRYSVAWIDGLATGRRLGRAVLTRGDHAKMHDLPVNGRRDPLSYNPRQRASVAAAPPLSVLNSLSLSVFNEMWFRKAPRRRLGQLQPIAAFFHPLDSLGRWNLLYGPKGFTQYQFVVPFGAEAVVRSVIERLTCARVTPFLSVLKCFGPVGPGHLSFPFEGWTLAIDIPVGAVGLSELLDGFDETVAEAGGRVYLSKDGRLRPDLLQTMYPRLEKWKAIRKRLDPEGLLASDLGRRLGLCGNSGDLSARVA